MSNKILEEKTSKTLISMSVPISLGMLSTFLFQVIDTYFVGQLGANALAALSFSSTLYFVLVGLFIGLTVGVSIIVGKAVGANDVEKVRKTTLTSLVLSFTLSALLALSGIMLIEPIFSLLGADEQLMPLISEYTVPLLCGIPLLTIGLTSGGILRASGNVSKPEILMAIAGVINLVLDYLFIFGKAGLPAIGIKGAAYATVSSWAVIVLGMFILMYKDQLLAFRTKAQESIGQLLSEIFRLGTPTILTQIIGPATMMYLTFLLARESPMAVAAFGVAGRIEILLMIGILGVSTAITPFIAQNMGAKKASRINEAIVFGGQASTYLGLLVGLLLFLFIKPIAALFSDNADVIRNTSNYFYIVSISYVLYAFYLVTTSILNGLQLPVNSLRISAVRSLLIIAPLTWLGSFWGTNGIFIGLSAGNILSGIYAMAQMRKELKRVKSPLAETSIRENYRNDLRKFIRLMGFKTS